MGAASNWRPFFSPAGARGKILKKDAEKTYNKWTDDKNNGAYFHSRGGTQFYRIPKRRPGRAECQLGDQRVTLWFDVVNSAGFSPEQKELIMSRLGNRIGKNGVLRVISQQTRSQAENKEPAVERFVELRRCDKQVPERKKTRVNKGAKLRRLEEKRQRSMEKQRGRKVPVED